MRMASSKAWACFFKSSQPLWTSSLHIANPWSSGLMKYTKIWDYPQHKKIKKIWHLALEYIMWLWARLTFLIMFWLKPTLVTFFFMILDFHTSFKKPIKHQLWFFLWSLLTSFFNLLKSVIKSGFCFSWFLSSLFLEFWSKSTYSILIYFFNLK